MSLSQYQKKRQFSKTPEPKGKVTQNNGPLAFVIQKHAASSLHYDFRLEMDGVLKSWAVPKGPSQNSEDKRLAMEVEDHPMDYANFEGIIPKGNYGGGTVMVWDKGVYMPFRDGGRRSGVGDGMEKVDGETDRIQAERILLEELKKGHLTFVMLGEKLKGEFALVKSSHMGENAWLLFKAGDEYASKKDILKEDKSVLSGRSMEEIAKQAEKKDQVWYSKPKDLDVPGTKSSMPHKIKPMLATAIDEPFSKDGWIFEIKWDGYRAVAEIENGKVNLYSRNLQPYNQKFAQIAESLKRFPGNAVLDGEVVVLDKDGHPNFQLLQDYPNSGGEITYYVFDLLFLDGHNLEHRPLLERKELLQKVLPPLPNITYSQHIERNGQEFFEQAKKLNLEGIMAKKADSLYHKNTRSKDWLKIKTHLRQEAIVCGFTAPKGGRQYFGALVLGVYRNKKLQYIGHTGGGFDDKTLKSILKKLKPLAQKKSPFETVPPTNAPVTWIKPRLVCEVEFAAWTNDGQMRQPIFMGLRDDKPTKGVEKERIFSKDAPEKDITEIEVGKQKIKLTNLNKIFWAEEKITKGDLIDYYREISSFILPYLKDRPESLLRYPNGIREKGFFHKDMKFLSSDWIKKVSIPSESHGAPIHYLLINDEASLIYAINMGCIDLNPWNSRVGHLENPDYLIIDLDPEDISFESVVKVAQACREVLESLGIESYPKTSGARGMHIYIPMGAKYTYEQTRHFAELLAVQIHSKVFDITSMVRNPKDRQGKVYLDFLQNSRGQTLASAYSVRAKPGATVSAPLKWSEVTSKLHPSQFTIKNMVKRLDSHGDLFKGVLGKGIDMEKVLKKLEKRVSE